MAGLSFDELAKLQSVEPLVNADVLAGGWPDDDEPEQALATQPRFMRTGSDHTLWVSNSEFGR